MRSRFLAAGAEPSISRLRLTSSSSEVERVRSSNHTGPGQGRNQMSAAAAHRSELEQLRERVAQLEQALDSRIVIEQAKGVLAERLAISVAEAFEILRYAARSQRTKLHEIARRVVEEKQTPAPVVVAIARASRVRAVPRHEHSQAEREQAWLGRRTRLPGEQGEEEAWSR